MLFLSWECDDYMCICLIDLSYVQFEKRVVLSAHFQLFLFAYVSSKGCVYWDLDLISAIILCWLCKRQWWFSHFLCAWSIFNAILLDRILGHRELWWTTQRCPYSDHSYVRHKQKVVKYEECWIYFRTLKMFWDDILYSQTYSVFKKKTGSQQLIIWVTTFRPWWHFIKFVYTLDFLKSLQLYFLNWIPTSFH